MFAKKKLEKGLKRLIHKKQNITINKGKVKFSLHIYLSIQETCHMRQVCIWGIILLNYILDNKITRFLPVDVKYLLNLLTISFKLSKIVRDDI